MMLDRSAAAIAQDERGDSGTDCPAAIEDGRRGVKSHHVTVVVLDPAAQLQLGWVIDILAEANRVSTADRFSWDVRSFADYAASGRSGSFQTPEPDCTSRLAVFIAGERYDLQLNDIERERLRRAVRRQSLAIACGPAVELFAACSLLRNEAAAASRTTSAWLRETYPDTRFSTAPLCWSGTIGTANGGVAIAAAVLEALSRLGLQALAREIRGRLLVPTLGIEQAGLSPRARFGARSRKIARAISFMQQNLEGTLPTERVAAHVGSSVRQLERLFKVQMDTTPARFLKRLRLEQARELLVNTDMPIVQIVCATGFESPTHFSKCFKREHQVAPTAWRRGRRTAAAEQGPARA